MLAVPDLLKNENRGKMDSKLRKKAFLESVFLLCMLLFGNFKDANGLQKRKKIRNGAHVKVKIPTECIKMC